MKVGVTGLTSVLAFATTVFLAGVALAGPVDTDGDGVLDEVDNCPIDYNPSQTNTDVSTDPPGDTVGDACDNCRDDCNVLQYDTNGDGCGNVCDPDFNNDGVIGLPDFSVITGNFGTTVPPSSPDWDIANGSTGCAGELADNVVGLPDFSKVTANFGGTPGPGVPPDTDCDGDGAP